MKYSGSSPDSLLICCCLFDSGSIIIGKYSEITTLFLNELGFLLLLLLNIVPILFGVWGLHSFEFLCLVVGVSRPGNICLF